MEEPRQIGGPEKGRREAEALRPQRVVNYRVKRAEEWTCQHEGCRANRGVLVVCRPGADPMGEGGLTTRCREHVEGWAATPGQWNER